MPSGIQVNGVDLDTIFTPFVTGHTPASATGIKVNGSDLNTRYDAVSYGSSPPNTGIQKNGTDLAAIFAANSSGNWTATLPSFPNPFTSSPQPASGTNSMMVTQTNSPGGTLYYTWSSHITPTGSAGSFNIVSGQGSDTIDWYATAVKGTWITIKVICDISTAPSGGTSIEATTTMQFHYGTPS
jgi:hypothetical protein